MRLHSHALLAITRSIPRDGEGGGTGNGDPGSAGTGGSEQQPKYLSEADFQAKFGGLAGKVRGISETLTTLSEASKNALTLDRLVEIGLVEKTEDGKYARPGTQKKQQQSADPNDAVLRQIEDLKKQLQQRDEALAEKDRKFELQGRESAVIAALQKHEALNPKRDARLLLDRVTKVDGRDGLFVQVEGEYGDATHVTIDDFIKGPFLKENPELFRSRGGTGSDTPNGGGKPGGKIVPFSTWSQPEWMLRNREKVYSGELQLEPER